MTQGKEKPTVVHIDLTCSFSEGFSYQENILPKYHVRMGYKVHFITTTWSWNKQGELVRLGEQRYRNPDDIEVIRIENDQNKPWDYRLKTHSKLLPLLEELNPDIVFLHCLQVRDSATVTTYVKKHPNCKLYVDNHADYSNSAKNFISKWVLHRIIWRHYAKKLIPFTEKFWGVLPARVDFLVENYGIPKDKCDLLVMGADDDSVDKASSAETVTRTRAELGFGADDVIVVTGGKIDSAKPQVLSLMEAVAHCAANVKLLVFGPVEADMQPRFNRALECDRITYVPWADTFDSYRFFAIADIIAFPGRHSVYWEQAAAMGKPLLIKRWDGTTHVDCGGNVAYTSGDDPDSIKLDLDAIVGDPHGYASMASAAQKAKGRFLYSQIARRSIEVEPGASC